MRRRIALFANGWGNECLREIGHGLQQVAEVNDIDIFAFVNYASYADTETNKLGEFNVFTIPKISDFDAAVVLANSFNTEIEGQYLRETIFKAGIPAVSVESKIEGMDFFGVDDYQGMSEITEHLITEHGVKDILYIGGIEGHSGNEIRKKAVIETAAKHDIIILDENILIGDFAAARAIDAFGEWRKNHTLPEAIICANDIMAIGICNYLKDERISIPDEIKVTGFDCLKVAGEYEPSITSVNRDWITMGRRIMESLLNKIEGKPSKSYEVMNSKMIKGESCGCTLTKEDTNTWKGLREKNKDVELNGFRVDQHFRHMFLAMRKIVTKEDMNKSLSDFFIKSTWLEGNDVMLALVPEFFNYSESSEEKKITYGYPNTMDAVCLICDKTPHGIRREKTSSIIFEASNRNSRTGVYLIAPIRSDVEMYGFIITTKGFSIVQSDILYIWTKHMSQYLELVKSNIAIDHLNKKLEALSVTDGLTGVYNRAGCETIIYTKVQECQNAGGQAVVMLADVDRLKVINDMYGHGAGDVAITTSISLLKSFLPKESMIGRFGGDEFMIAVPCMEKMDVDVFADELMNKITKAPATKEFSYKISLSIGGVQLDSGKKFNIQEVLSEMDEKVYKIKELHHKEDNKG